MAEIIADDMDFKAYEQEDDAKQKVKPASSWADEVVKRMLNPEGARGFGLPWPETLEQFRLRPNEITIWSGINGHGKSLLLSQVMIQAMEHGQRVLMASLEMRPVLTLERMVRQAIGKRHCNEAEIRAFHQWTDDRLWLYDHVGAVQWRKFMAVCRWALVEKKVDHIVIDSLMRLGVGEQDYDGQKAAVDALCDLRNDYPVNVHLVMHSRKLADEMSPPGKFDVKGTGTMTDLADNVMTVWRNKRKESDPDKHRDDCDAMIVCDKQRNGEWEGRVRLWFDAGSQQFMAAPAGRGMGVRVYVNTKRF
jgi:twinkle protein